VYKLRYQGGEAEPFSFSFLVKSPNLELGNLRTNFEHLFLMASDASPLLERLRGTPNEGKLKAAVKNSRETYGKDIKGDRLFFKLKHAEIIPELLVNVPPDVNRNKGKFEDLWDKGTDTLGHMLFHYVAMIAVGCIGLVATAILLFIGRHYLAIGVLIGSALVVLGFWLADLMFSPEWLMMPLAMSTVLGLVVGLLSLEWLSRKLLKLA
jgi:hypothetical protein